MVLTKVLCPNGAWDTGIHGYNSYVSKQSRAREIQVYRYVPSSLPAIADDYKATASTCIEALRPSAMLAHLKVLVRGLMPCTQSIMTPAVA
ncbi:hypothetical protein IAQ61_005610 [Plenodomus lingam]|uniref:uncharacterized protein n=1 Tax=Leptosphaeria maculans TaxID=5022 RepID=UPI0033272A62|nr:hypothetical protein IAQ61_005610 [Plenodomus lingam]